MLAIAWIVCWLFGLITILQNFSPINLQNKEGKSFFPVWLTIWTIAGLLTIIGLFWGFFGLENLSIDNENATFRKSIFGIGPKAKFKTSEIKNIRLSIPQQTMFEKFSRPLWGIWSGKISFDTENESHCFGLGLLDSEASSLIDILKNHLGQINRI